MNSIIFSFKVSSFCAFRIPLQTYCPTLPFWKCILLHENIKGQKNPEDVFLLLSWFLVLWSYLLVCMVTFYLFVFVKIAEKFWGTGWYYFPPEIFIFSSDRHLEDHYNSMYTRADLKLGFKCLWKLSPPVFPYFFKSVHQWWANFWKGPDINYFRLCGKEVKSTLL